MAYPYEVVRYGLKDASSSEESLQIVQKWERDGWGAQMGAAKVLCTEPGKGKISTLLGNIAALNFCRVVR